MLRFIVKHRVVLVIFTSGMLVTWLMVVAFFRSIGLSPASQGTVVLSLVIAVVGGGLMGLAAERMIRRRRRENGP